MKRVLISFSFGAALVILISTIYPRIVALGYFPHMDEGVYAYWGMLIHQSLAEGHGLPAAGGLSLYPLLLSWTFSLPGVLAVWLRMADMLVAICAAWLFCRLMVKESGSRVVGLLVSLAFLCAMNRLNVIEAGFKNAIFAAYIPLFMALRLCQKPLHTSSARWYAVGALTALAVLLREPFVTFAVLGLLSIWIGWGFGAAWRYAVGGVLFGLAALILLVIGRGDMASLVHYYVNLSEVYAAESWRIGKKFIWNGLYSLASFAGPLGLTVLAGGVFVMARRLCRKGGQPIAGDKRALFWLVAALLPLLEPLSKVGFIYHFAVCLPGFAGLCALAWQRVEQCPSLFRLKRLGVPLASLACLLALTGLPGPAKLGMTLNVLRQYPNTTWPEQYVSQSNTLLAAKALHDILPGGATLSTSGHTFFLYEVLGVLPPTKGTFAPQDIFHLSDLGRAYLALGKDAVQLAGALRANPPDALAVGFTYSDHESTFVEGVVEAVRLSGLYELVATIPVNNSLNYGWMGYYIYQRRLDIRPRL